MSRVVLAAFACLSLAACASAPTHYQPATGGGAVGWSEMRIETGRYRVTFQGGAGASEAQVHDFALLRAADLALAEGYDWFQVVEKRVQQTGYGGSAVSFGIGGATFGRHSASGASVESGFPLGGGPALAVTLEVLMGRGPHPEAGDVYDARSVRSSVGPRAL